MMVSIPQNTTLEEGDEVPVAATVIMNDGGATWIGYEDFLVVSQDDEYNVMVRIFLRPNFNDYLKLCIMTLNTFQHSLFTVLLLTWLVS